jgi:predicted amidophosphoribosyltransferase
MGRNAQQKVAGLECHTSVVPSGAVWRDVVDGLGRALFPAMCVACGDVRGEPLCGACAATLVAARPAPAPLAVDRLVAVYAYDGTARELVARVKYRNARHAIAFLGAAVAAAAQPVVAPGTVVTWPPTTRARRRARGFDAAELLARSVGAALHLPVTGLLRRVDGQPQTGRAATERRRGPRFSASSVAPATVLVVDDVTTTGATLTAAAVALRAAGATRVVAAAAARTPAGRASARRARQLAVYGPGSCA